ncbi:MAG: hypothetical protein Q7R58_00465 [bacterium]|nr:hypothetical protein [bacterium]
MLSIGTTVVYHNRLTDFHSHEILCCFTLLTLREIEGLEINDTVWVPRDSFGCADHGEIRGYTKVQMVKVGFTTVSAFHRQKHFSYNSRNICGFTAVEGALQHEKFWRADEGSLRKLIQELPLASVSRVGIPA